MTTEPERDLSISKQDQLDLASQQLQGVLQNLKQTKKVLARDWAELTPRERSAYARQVKELENEQQTLLKEIELLNIEMSS